MRHLLKSKLGLPGREVQLVLQIIDRGKCVMGKYEADILNQCSVDVRFRFLLLSSVEVQFLVGPGILPRFI